MGVGGVRHGPPENGYNYEGESLINRDGNNSQYAALGGDLVRACAEEVNAERIVNPGDAIVLIERAVASIESDRERARQCLKQATALLRGTSLRVTSTPQSIAIRGGLARWQLIRVMTHIEDHLERGIRIGDLAAIARVSSSHLSRGFKASTGTTPLVFVNRRRIARACEMMKTTDQSLCAIAIACGLCDQAHFSRVFRRFIGSTPSRWRKVNADLDRTSRQCVSQTCGSSAS
jgi:AraC family transcriptional regulator